MRLLWEESGFELVGAFCVAAFSLGAAWTVFESMFGLNAVVAGLFSAAVAGWVLEMISRRHYADRLAPAPHRTASSPRRSAGARLAGAERPSADASPSGPAPAVSSTAAPGPAAAATGGPAPAAAPGSPSPRSPAAEDPARDRSGAAPGPRGAATVAGRRAGAVRRAA